MKQTLQKEAILNKVKEMHNHPSADEIYQALKLDEKNISLATVYRNLNKFSKDKKITKVEISGSSDRFDYRLDEHQHFWCENCGKVFDIEVDVKFNVNDKDSKVNGYNLLFYGICKNCMNKT